MQFLRMELSFTFSMIAKGVRALSGIARKAKALLLRLMFYVDSQQGRIGSFWWVNGVTSQIELHDALYNGSVHFVWRPGISGWGDPLRKSFQWLIIQSNNFEHISQED